MFGTLDQKELSIQARVNYVLSPKMSLQMYMQPLISVGDYHDFKQLRRPRSFEFVTFGVDGGSVAFDPVTRRYEVNPADEGNAFGFDDPDFNFKSLRVNAIFRWEWRPGSALYLWTEQRQDTSRPGRMILRRDISGLFSAPADDVIMMKVAYWLQR